MTKPNAPFGRCRSLRAGSVEARLARILRETKSVSLRKTKPKSALRSLSLSRDDNLFGMQICTE
jgi:hypothetical protein